MRVVLLRVGIDTGAGGIRGPLFEDGSFEFIPIPDGFNLDERTYGNTRGRTGAPFVQFFPERRRSEMRNKSMHVDPEFESFTYGDPTSLKGRLRKLSKGDLLVFYCGLKGWDHPREPALYLCGFFAVETAGLATSFSDEDLRELFSENFHVRHSEVFSDQMDRLVLVKGGPGSRLLKRAVRISTTAADSAGRPYSVLSVEMQRHFGDWNGKIGIQRSAPRWVEPEFVEGAAEFVRGLT